MSKTYDIKIDYSTGNSFGTERINGESVPALTDDIKIARENLQRIKKHYAECKENPNSGKDYDLTLLTDDGEKTINPFWMGWFETLHGAKIVLNDEFSAFEI